MGKGTLSALGLLAVLVLIHQPYRTAAQLSKAVAHDSNMNISGNKFLKREATGDVQIGTDKHEVADEKLEYTCAQNIALKWHAEASSAIYATPLITDLFSDGRKDVVVPSFLHQLEVFEGRDGAKVPDFEAFHHSTTHTSPLMYDIDLDGVPDILLATYDGEILFFKDNGEEAVTRLTIPRLRVRRDWHKGLNPDPNDRSQSDVGKGGGLAQVGTDDEKAAGSQQQAGGQQGGQEQQRRRHLMEDTFAGQQQEQQQGQGQGQQQQQGQEQGQQQEQQQGQGQGQQQQAQQQQQQNAASDQQQAAEGAGQANQQQGQAGGGGGDAAGVEKGEALSDEAADSFNELFGMGEEEEATGFAFRDVDDGSGTDEGAHPGAGSENAAAAKEAVPGGTDAPKGAGSGVQNPRLPHTDVRYKGHRGKQERPHGWEDEGIANDYNPDYALMHERGNMWDDEFFVAQPHKEAPAASPFVYIDAHVLTTPSIADIDGDGSDELVVAVSYFFDRHYYEKEEHRLELGKDLDLGQYVASGVVVFDLHRRSIKWSQHLDLSVDYTSFKAYAYSAPTLADIDNNGKMEIIMGTSMGFLYVLDCYGATRPGFPLQMGAIQAQVAVADINADGQLEMVAADDRGNVAAFTAMGKEVWETHLSSHVHQNAVFGDVDGDGLLEVVLTTLSGHVHVLKASSGKAVEPFPFRVFGRVITPPLLTKLDSPLAPGLQIVVTAMDGFLYVIDGIAGCADSLDIGETSNSMVLADDLDGNGKLDLLVSTMNGNLYCIATSAQYHPLKSWPQQYIGGGTFTARWGWEGVYVTTESRKPRDVRGQTLPLRFKIVDHRQPVVGVAAATEAAEGKAKAVGGKAADEGEDAVGGTSSKRRAIPGRGPYKVSLLLTGVGQREMNAGEHPVIGMADVFNATGVFTMEIPCPRSRSTATIRVEMRDETKLLFVDEFSLSFHIHFYRLLKWLIAGPFVAATLALLAFRADTGALPAWSA